MSTFSSLVTYVLVILFGSSSWISVNAMWIQLPLMVNVLPEGWALPSYLAVIVQLAFVGPLFFALAKKLYPLLSKRSTALASLNKHYNPSLLIYACLTVLVLSHLLLAIFWSHTTTWSNGQTHSTTLFILFFFLSLVNCMSNVLYLPYMFRFRPTYTTAYFVGMGFGAFVPSVLGLIQGSGRIDCVYEHISANGSNETIITPRSIPPLFSVGVFNGLLCCWLSLVIIGFYLLNRLPDSHTDLVTNVSDETGNINGKSRNDETEESKLTRGIDIGAYGDDKVAATAEDDSAAAGRRRQEDTLSSMFYLYLLIITAWVCAFMNGVLPSVQSFATLPYGLLTYHLAVTISNLANPVACFVPFFIQVRRMGLVISVWTLIGTMLAAYILMAAAWSPEALLGNDGSVGPAFSILSWTLVTGVLAYLRTVIAGVLRESGGGGAKVENRLFWCGLFTQGGAFVGAMIMFPLVNVVRVFRTAPSCPTL